jgi:cell division control protein 45
MIAQMGIPLKEAEQSFYHMQPKSKKALKSLMVEVGKEFGLDDVSYGSFHLRNGYKFQLSAADAVYGIMALLAGHGKRRNVEEQTQEEECRNNFWEAFDAVSSVSSRTTEKIEEGLRRAIELQQTVVKQGSHMIAKRIITTSGVFRYAYLKDTADTHLFLNPQALTKLAHFLVAHYREKYSSKPRPFVLCALDSDREVYHVVAVDGTPGTSATGDVGRNKFGSSFNKAAEKTGARVKHDGFETSIMEVEKEDIYKFMEYLHSGLC